LKNCDRFFGVVVLWFLQGILAKTVFFGWYFCGEFVVECVANEVKSVVFFGRRKTGHRFEIYFRLTSPPPHY
jgi:hypothetical protein